MVEIQRLQPPIRLGTITQMEAFMKHWWKQSALYNAQPCTLLHFQLIRSAQLQKGERLPRQPPISPPPSPFVPLSRLLSAEVAWQREVQPLLYWNHCKNMHLHNKACVESWEQRGNRGCRFMGYCSAVKNKTKKRSIKRGFKLEGCFYLFWNNGIVLQTRACPWILYSPFEWVSVLHPGAMLWGGLRITRVGAEVRPRTDAREECAE